MVQAQDLDLHHDLRSTLVALVEEERRRAERSGWTYGGAGAVLVGVGGLGALGGSRTALGLGIAGSVQLVGSQVQIVDARGRHAGFVARLAHVEGRAGALRSLAVDRRRALDRQARHHALATGVWSGILALGVAGFAVDPDRAGELFLGLGVGSLPAVIHHAARWRAASRFAADLDTALVRPVPTVLPRAVP